MESLLANYASSDEEEDQKPQSRPPNPSSLFSSLPKPKSEPQHDSTSSLFSSLPKPKPKPKPSSLFQTLPKPKIEQDQDPHTKPSSVFSSLPPPKTQISSKPPSSSSQIPKKVVQFKPPINPYPSHLDHDDDDDEEEERRRRKASEASSAQPLSVTSFLSAIPAPRNSGLGASSGLGSGAGSGRRAILDTESFGAKVESDVCFDQNGNENVASYNDQQSNFDPNVVSYEGYGGYESYQYGGEQNVDAGVGLQAGISGGDAQSYGGYSGYSGNSGNAWADGPAAMGVSSEVKAVNGKRRRNDVPTEILEVKQDELMKNRPREDQAKSTGIAFGPSYQAVSTKGKPTKLHKRKHQIGSLYFDMKQKEMELQERRSRGFLTKAETQAKYGW